MSDNERPHESRRAGRDRRDPRDSRAGDRERVGTPSDRRQRSRSPRRERGGRRSDNNRYRSRSPDSRHGRDRDSARGPLRDDRRRDDHDKDDRSRRDAPRGLRGNASAPTGPRKSDHHPHNGPSKPPSGPRGAEPLKKEETPDIEMKDEKEKPEDMDDETWQMMRTMGFGGFKSTKDMKVPGNDKNYGVRKDKRMEARQYMNRQGGFNRPLSPSRG